LDCTIGIFQEIGKREKRTPRERKGEKRTPMVSLPILGALVCGFIPLPSENKLDIVTETTLRDGIQHDY